MPIGLIGRKCGMTRVFTEQGISIPVTVVLVDPNRVTQVKTVATDGYRALQVTVGSKRASHLNKAKAGHFAKANIEAGRGLWEFPLADNEGEGLGIGHVMKVDVFQVGQKVDVSGITKGKGFAGTIKRHHFRSQDATHGNSLSHRVPGSVGMNQSPGRVFRGKKMAGHLGNAKRTVQNQEIVRIDAQRNLLLIKGVIPGAPGGDVMVLPSVKAKNKGGAKE